MADLSALSHQWRDAREPGAFAPWWTCPKCLLSSASAFDALCPDLVSQALDRAHAERDEARALVEAIERQKRAEADADEALALAGQLQDAVRDAIIDFIGAEHSDRIDGGCSDGGAVDFTVAEVRQGLAVMQDRVDDMRARLAPVLALDLDAPRCRQCWTVPQVVEHSLDSDPLQFGVLNCWPSGWRLDCPVCGLDVGGPETTWPATLRDRLPEPVLAAILAAQGVTRG